MFSMTWALPRGYDWELKDFVRQVKTKAWAKRHQLHVRSYANRFTTAGNDHAKTVKSMLESAYGVNIGGQVFAKLTTADIDKIRTNVMGVV